MKKLVVIVSLMLVSAFGFSQEKNEKATTIKTESTTVETPKVEVSKDSTKAVAFVSNRAIIESNFDKASFLFRGRKSKRVQLC